MPYIHPFQKQFNSLQTEQEQQSFLESLEELWVQDNVFPSLEDEDAFQLWAEELLPVEEESFINHVAPAIPPATPPGYYSGVESYYLDLAHTDDEDSNEKRPSLKRIYNEIE